MDQQVSQQPEEKSPSGDRVTARMWLLTILAIVILPAVVLFGSAGTFQWPMAWLYIGLTAATFLVSRLIVWRANPDLLRERGRSFNHDNTAPFDRILSPLLGFGGTILIGLVAGFAIRFSWTPIFAAWVQWLGVVILILGYVFGSWALVENRFFSGVVRIQTERDHHVINSGPYAFVRHPGYLGAFVSYLGMVLMLGSPWALIPFLLQQVVLVTRTSFEDRYLQAELPGYKEYTEQTRFRLFPGIW